MEKLSIFNVDFDPEGPLPRPAFCNGIRRYAQVASLLGLNSPNYHSKFIVICNSRAKSWLNTGGFILNRTDKNRAVQKAQYLINHPDLYLIPETQRGETRDEWPGAIRIFYQKIATSEVQLHKPENTLIIANSGVPAFIDIMLIAAFTIGISEINPKWSLVTFYCDTQYATALRLAARHIILAAGSNTSYSSGIENTHWQTWHKRNPDKLNLEISILRDNLKSLFPDPD